ncbi:DNA polymerase III subunit gamma/tau [Rhodoplanes sp. Z2-YC6860]|uniref:DNA polymerase III subunit gamma/tau n=1 Tax=Rhodoplanes sp. Z2-YC6860 TaxID=674703 RepID=UPI00078D705A|nr:DNA polymerase III subunit gamma/tau [Rhodoplanes sp. Z2-YC6860]AMN45087.1 DNA polymerase III subunit gamma/tau [Rhodoplanes sp. Z2-YC6860]
MNDATKTDLDLGGPGGNATAASYRVLARKYRPSNFNDLIGQEAMVRTISNAFETGRIPQAWILTGVRGVGKTTTARILARALNYELADGSVKGPTIDLPTFGLHCQAIMESRHIDVIEMDAASHNGVDDVRQINDAVRYAPVNARYKVYILDEVHMLSTAAFNALLKTLEEPPPHAKFIFATTEIREVPVTVLSRCQRFDLRRIDAATLVKHLGGIAEKENIEVEQEALALVARAAEGSVRDSLSLFDQAIAHAAGKVRAEDVRQMLGLADRTRVIDLFEALMKGDVAAALTELREQYDIGADPAVVIADLAEFTHFVTRMKIVPSVADDVSLGEVERTRGRALATALSIRVLSRTWQMLLKGTAEVEEAGRPLAAAEMVLVRIAYVADLPTPDEAIRTLNGGEGGATPRPSGNGGGAGAGAASAAAPSQAPRFEAPRGAPRAVAVAREPMAQASASQPQAASQPQSAPALVIRNFAELVALAADKRDIQLKLALERDMRLVRCEDGKLEIALEETASKVLVNDLSRKLQLWTGRPWVVVISREEGAPTLKSVADAQKAELEIGVRADPLVKAVLERFPGAEIVSVRGQKDAAQDLPAAEPEIPLPDDSGFGDNWERDDNE